jgi:hypothetical protein
MTLVSPFNSTSAFDQMRRHVSTHPLFVNSAIQFVLESSQSRFLSLAGIKE